MHFQTAYLKLTLFYVAIVMAISLIFSVVIYKISSVEINRGLGNQTSALRQMPLSSNPFVDELERIRQSQLEESNDRIAINLIYFNLMIFILSSVGSYFFAQWTLHPIEESMKAQNRFTADASHELRTPLTAIKIETEVSLRDKNLNLAEAKKLLQSNLEEVDKLEHLSSALLKLAKLEEYVKTDFKKVSLDEVVEESFEKIKKLADKKSITLIYHPERPAINNRRPAKLFVSGDQQSLVELIIILLDNAVKYSPDHSKVAVDIKKSDKHVELEVSDHGIGIKESDLPYIFNRFYRADISRCKQKVEGYGLGLSIAKRIVELHSGTISAQSKAGHGSQFTVKFDSV